ncbi:MAG TPA: bifunctional nicotinamide-nucleotide adenylyltransferase/Nudix hydroxylase [Methanosarcina sp.]|nr:bifunctional nicotinamide-nucleotide adenylyltransferase/Nudix hydroxylase [Methanosarcina sp.]
MRKQKTLSVFIGRMSPFHNGHAAILNEICSYTDDLLVLIGSSYRSRSLKNPFTYFERAGIIDRYLTNRKFYAFGIRSLEDNPYNDNEWIASVQTTIRQYQEENGLLDYQVELVASDKEDLSSYPHWFPGFKKRILSASVDDSGKTMAATDIRSEYFGSPYSGISDEIVNSVPQETVDFLQNFKYDYPEIFDNLTEEYQFIKEYRKSWDVAPYPVNFVTTDAVVVQSGHIALIQRRDNPGKDLWALPGGFLNVNERIVDGCVRELREETGIKVAIPVLKGSIQESFVFDNPMRSDRGRTITHGFYFKLADEKELPHIKGCDDAKKAKWIPISELYGMRDQFFEDHYWIIKKFLKF